MSDAQRQRCIARFVRSERRRPELETTLSKDPVTIALWNTFPKTEQREILSGIDYVRFWPRKLAVRQAVRGVRLGSDYRRLEEQR